MINGNSSVSGVVYGIDNTGSNAFITGGNHSVSMSNKRSYVVMNGNTTVSGGTFNGTNTNTGIIVSSDPSADMKIIGGTIQNGQNGVTVTDGHVLIGGSVFFSSNAADIYPANGKTFELADDFRNTATVALESPAPAGSMTDITSNVPSVGSSKITAADSENYETLIDPENGRFAMYTKPEVIFEANGGISGTIKSSGKLAYTDALSYTIPDETVPAASEEAFTFMGWSNSNEAAVPEYKAGSTQCAAARLK